jgi:thiamine biosynthesis lipoprotein
MVALAVEAMRTRFELVMHGEDEAFLRAVGEEALAEIEACEQRFNFFDKASLLSHVNTNAETGWARVDSEAFDLLRACAVYHTETSAAFDVTVGPLMAALGFHGARGTRDEIEQARQRVGMHLVELDAERQAVRFVRKGVRLDLGGVAKGYALDLAADILREHGVASALLHGGTSTIIAIGAPPGEDAWRIALGSDATDPQVHLRDRAFAVSAPHGREIEAGGSKLGHVLDPRTGKPTQAASLAAVICDSAARADAWSTALLVLGRATVAADRDLTALIRSSGRAPKWSTLGGDRACFHFPQRTSAADERKESA